MRLILAIAATACAASVVIATTTYAQKTAQTTAQAPANPSAARASLNENYNRCVSLARSRGYTDSDLDGNRTAARNFVLRCMQGKQR
jgi:hypothetical protein